MTLLLDAIVTLVVRARDDNLGAHLCLGTIELASIWKPLIL